MQQEVAFNCFDGLRARDESGLRLKYAGDFGRLQLRVTTDAWLRKRQQAAQPLPIGGRPAKVQA